MEDKVSRHDWTFEQRNLKSIMKSCRRMIKRSEIPEKTVKLRSETKNVDKENNPDCMLPDAIYKDKKNGMPPKIKQDLPCCRY